MPTQLTTFNPVEIRLKWLEEYVTDGLNKKNAVLNDT